MVYRNKKLQLLILIFSMLYLLSFTAYAKDKEKRLSEKYTPTKLEWICLTLNSLNSIDFTNDKYVIVYKPKEPSTIKVSVLYLAGHKDSTVKFVNNETAFLRTRLEELGYKDFKLETDLEEFDPTTEVSNIETANIN